MRGITRRGPIGAPAILFLHGGVINRRMWDPVMDHLDDRFDCIAIDLPAHGDLSDQSFNVERSVALVLDVLDESGIDRAALVGLSLGGYVAQAFAAAHPERSSGLLLSGATIRYTGWDGLSTRLYGFVFPLLARPAKKAFAKQLRKLDPKICEPMLEGGLSMKGGGQALRRLPGRDYAEELAGYAGPIVIANGERDEGNRDGEDGFRDRLPAASFVVIDDAGHACAVSQPEAFAAAVDGLMAGVTA